MTKDAVWVGWGEEREILRETWRSEAKRGGGKRERERE